MIRTIGAAALACAVASGSIACGGSDDDGASPTDGTAAATQGSTSAAAGTAAADSSSGAPTEATTSGADESTTGTQTAEGSTDSSSGAPDDGVITFDEIQPIFVGRCSPCHTGAMFGGHNVGGSDVEAGYAAMQLDAEASACRGLNKGACLLVRIQSGEMPMNGGCSGDPAVDAGAANCLTQADQDTIQAWIDDGQLPPV